MANSSVYVCFIEMPIKKITEPTPIGNLIPAQQNDHAQEEYVVGSSTILSSISMKQTYTDEFAIEVLSAKRFLSLEL